MKFNIFLKTQLISKEIICWGKSALIPGVVSDFIFDSERYEDMFSVFTGVSHISITLADEDFVYVPGQQVSMLLPFFGRKKSSWSYGTDFIHHKYKRRELLLDRVNKLSSMVFSGHEGHIVFAVLQEKVDFNVWRLFRKGFFTRKALKGMFYVKEGCAGKFQEVWRAARSKRQIFRHVKLKRQAKRGSGIGFRLGYPAELFFFRGDGRKSRWHLQFVSLIDTTRVPWYLRSKSKQQKSAVKPVLKRRRRKAECRRQVAVSGGVGGRWSFLRKSGGGPAFPGSIIERQTHFKYRRYGVIRKIVKYGGVIYRYRKLLKGFKDMYKMRKLIKKRKLKSIKARLKLKYSWACFRGFKSIFLPVVRLKKGYLSLIGRPLCAYHSSLRSWMRGSFLRKLARAAARHKFRVSPPKEAAQRRAAGAGSIMLCKRRMQCTGVKRLVWRYLLAQFYNYRKVCGARIVRVACGYQLRLTRFLRYLVESFEYIIALFSSVNVVRFRRLNLLVLWSFCRALFRFQRVIVHSWNNSMVWSRPSSKLFKLYNSLFMRGHLVENFLLSLSTSALNYGRLFPLWSAARFSSWRSKFRSGTWHQVKFSGLRVRSAQAFLRLKVDLFESMLFCTVFKEDWSFVLVSGLLGMGTDDKLWDKDADIDCEEDLAPADALSKIVTTKFKARFKRKFKTEQGKCRLKSFLSGFDKDSRDMHFWDSVGNVCLSNRNQPIGSYPVGSIRWAYILQILVRQASVGVGCSGAAGSVVRLGGLLDHAAIFEKAVRRESLKFI